MLKLIFSTMIICRKRGFATHILVYRPSLGSIRSKPMLFSKLPPLKCFKLSALRNLETLIVKTSGWFCAWLLYLIPTKSNLECYDFHFPLQTQRETSCGRVDISNLNLLFIINNHKSHLCLKNLKDESVFSRVLWKQKAFTRLGPIPTWEHPSDP